MILRRFGGWPRVDDLVGHVGRAASRLWAPAERVVMGVSGGADSVALLHLLLRSQPVHRGRLSVVTIDHGLRPGSDADARWVAEHCAELGLECTTVAVTCEDSEASARSARFEVFERLEADWVALAHHADDQVETVLINLLRGTGPRGLAGMRTRRGRYVRPLLGQSVSSVRAWLRAQDLGWREDPTNQDPRYLRNRVRAELVPLMESIRPGARKGVLRVAQTLGEVDELLAAEASAMGPPPWRVAGLPASVLRKAVLSHLPRAENRHVDALLEMIRRGGGAVTLPGGVVARVAGGELRLEQPANGL